MSGSVSLGDHPLATIFPLLEGAAFFDDIRAHGVREKLVLFEGKIDGRNRYRAAISTVASIGAPDSVLCATLPLLDAAIEALTFWSKVEQR